LLKLFVYEMNVSGHVFKFLHNIFCSDIVMFYVNQDKNGLLYYISQRKNFLQYFDTEKFLNKYKQIVFFFIKQSRDHYAFLCVCVCVFMVLCHTLKSVKTIVIIRDLCIIWEILFFNQISVCRIVFINKIFIAVVNCCDIFNNL
jgi:hypothetical protein